MFKWIIISLVCPLFISVFPILETVASAATCPAGYKYKCVTIGGTKCCGCWKTGSEICTPEVSELKNINGCVQGVDCPVLTCSATGTVDLSYLGYESCDLNRLPPDPNCGIRGVVFCGKKLNPSPTPSPTPSEYERREVILSTFLTGELEICDGEGCCGEIREVDTTCCEKTSGGTTCYETTKEGTIIPKKISCGKTTEGITCQYEIELDLESDCPNGTDECCIDPKTGVLTDKCCIDPKTGVHTECCPDSSDYPVFITFTASKFIGQIYVCPGGFSTDGVCCASKERRKDDKGLHCVEEVKVEDPLNQQCSLGKDDFAEYDPGETFYYKCTSFPDDFGSGR
ncbi:MAG TPA: hypothetical protein VHT73_04720 [Thermodesulfobacteriota bacterium]|nr:hypothetical protein [Thermodesulfobacteriota bacterium]